jgi:hypothetical protein
MAEYLIDEILNSGKKEKVGRYSLDEILSSRNPYTESAIPQVNVNPPDEETGFFDAMKQVPGMIKEAVTGEEEREKLKGVPEFRMDMEAYKKNPLSAIKTTVGMLISTDDEGRKNIIKKNFPEWSVYDKNGVTWIKTPEGEEAVLNKPGVSGNDIYNLAFDTGLFLLANRLGVKALAPGASLGVKTGTMAASAGMAEISKEAAAYGLGSEQKIGAVEPLVAAGTEALGEFIPGKIQQKAVSKAKERLGIRQEVDKALMDAIKEGEEINKVTGFGLTRGQITEDPFELGVMNILADQKGASHVAAKQLKAQNERVYERTLSFLNDYAPEDVIDDAAENIIRTSQKRLKELEDIRDNAARPYYERAYKDETLYSAGEALNYIDSQIEKQSGGIKASLRRVRNDIVEKVPDESGGKKIVEKTKSMTVEQIDNLKRSIDDDIGKAKRAGQNNKVRILKQAKDIFIDGADKNNPDYKKARRLWEMKNKKVQDYLKTKPGKLSDFDAVDMEKLDKVRAEIFKNTSSIKTLRQTKSIIEDVDPKAWRDLVRYEIENRLSKIKVDPEQVGKTIRDVPALMYTQLFGNPKQKALLYAAVDKDTSATMKYFERGLEKAAKGRPGGSRTASAQEYIKDIRDSGLGGSIRKFVKEPIKTAGEIGQELSVERKMNIISKAVFDPEFRADFRDLRKLYPTSKKAENKLSGILKKAAKKYGPATTIAIEQQTQD